MIPVEITLRDGPLVLSMPHCGTGLPDEVAGKLNDLGREVSDTDWWIDRLYDFAEELDASVARATLSRYVIDLNRDPSGQSLYPGQATTGLCPTETFDGEPIYAPGAAPDAKEIEVRKAAYYAPYHQALRAALDRARNAHGAALLYDCHSIRSVVPRLFEGELPVVNLGTNGGASCDPGMQAAVAAVCAAQSTYSHVSNGRFKGGWITRHYGRPAEGVHALQVELSQRAYMDEAPPWTFRDDLARQVRPLLMDMQRAMIDWASQNLGVNR